MFAAVNEALERASEKFYSPLKGENGEEYIRSLSDLEKLKPRIWSRLKTEGQIVGRAVLGAYAAFVILALLTGREGLSDSDRELLGNASGTFLLAGMAGMGRLAFVMRDWIRFDKEYFEAQKLENITPHLKVISGRDTDKR